MVSPLSALAAALEVLALSDWDEIKITGISYDSRRIGPGEIFVAIPGFVADGHDYISAAVARGAAAVVSERAVNTTVPTITVQNSRVALAQLAAAFYGHPTHDLFTVGVTGTNGKTTVCHLAAHILGSDATALLSTVATEQRGMHAVTTPEAPFIQRFAWDAAHAGKKNLVLEVSSAGLALHRTDCVDFDVAVFTNLTHDHLDFHTDREEYLHAKLRLFTGLKRDGVAIINRDDPVSGRFIAATRARVVTYAIHRQAELRAVDVKYSLQRTRFTLKTDAGSIPVEIALPAEHNVYNALAAFGIGIAAGVPFTEIVARLATARSVTGRYQFFRATTGATVIVDFAHSPDSLERMLRSLRPYYKRIICVFGCGGESDRAKRPIMGRISATLSDYTIITTDNPKTEDPARIIAEITAGMPVTARYETIIDRKAAIRRAIAMAGPDDGVLIAGKGHEPYQIIGHTFVPYNDADFLRAAGLVE